MKKVITIEIEKALKGYRPKDMGGRTLNTARQKHVAYEVPVICGTHKGGLIDAVHEVYSR